MNLEQLIALFFATGIMNIKPGPYVLTVSSLSLSGRLKEIAAFILGGYISGTISFILLISGVNLMQANIEFTLILVKALAAAYFIWLGIDALNKAQESRDWKKDTEDYKSGILSKSVQKNLLAGFLLTASNPFFIIMVLGIVPGVIDVTTLSTADLIIARIVLIFSNLAAISFYIIPLYFSRKFIGEGILKKLDIATSIAMILIGLYLGYQALPAEELGLL